MRRASCEEAEEQKINDNPRTEMEMHPEADRWQKKQNRKSRTRYKLTPRLSNESVRIGNSKRAK
jgi:hypothetical protein